MRTDGITLEFDVDTCNADLEGSVVESPATVEVTITARNDTTSDCRDMLLVVLEEPLGDRDLVDGATGRVLEVRLLDRSGAAIESEPLRCVGGPAFYAPRQPVSSVR